jgi:hypothetical protein
MEEGEQIAAGRPQINNDRTSGYPLMLAGVYALLGPSERATYGFNTFIGTAIVILAFLLTLLMFKSERAALLAAAMFSVEPHFIFYSATGDALVFYILLCMLSICAITIAFRSLTWYHYGLALALLAYTSLTRFEFLSVSVPVSVFLFVMYARAGKKWHWYSLGLLVMLLMASPSISYIPGTVSSVGNERSEAALSAETIFLKVRIHTEDYLRKAAEYCPVVLLALVGLIHTIVRGQVKYILPVAGLLSWAALQQSAYFFGHPAIRYRVMIYPALFIVTAFLAYHGLSFIIDRLPKRLRSVHLKHLVFVLLLVLVIISQSVAIIQAGRMQVQKGGPLVKDIMAALRQTEPESYIILPGTAAPGQMRMARRDNHVMYKDMYPGSKKYQELTGALARGVPVYLVAFDAYFDEELDFTVYDWPPKTYEHGAIIRDYFALELLQDTPNLDVYSMTRR